VETDLKKSGVNTSMNYYKMNDSLLTESQVMNEPLKKMYHLHKQEKFGSKVFNPPSIV
jgi:TfoX/Sxy family transcriptional regulator of competence genes